MVETTPTTSNQPAPDKDSEHRRSMLLPLIALAAGLIIGWLMFQAGNNQNSNNSVGTGAETSTPCCAGGRLSRDQENYQLAVTQYAQLLPETARESVDAPSEEATAAQAILQQQSTIVADSLTDRVTTTEGVVVPAADIAVLLAAFNTAIIVYTASAQIGTVDQTGVDKAGRELLTTLAPRDPENRQRFTDLFTSYKNAVLESTRSFAQGNYGPSYQKQLESQTAAVELFDLIWRR